VATSLVSDGASSQAVTLATVRSLPVGAFAVISAAISEILAPGRSTHARTLTGATGTAPRRSRVTRAMRSPDPIANSSMALVINAKGGEPCCISAFQLLAVPAVDSNTWYSPSVPSRR
jgi:hypothetical protein